MCIKFDVLFYLLNFVFEFVRIQVTPQMYTRVLYMILKYVRGLSITIIVPESFTYLLPVSVCIRMVWSVCLSVCLSVSPYACVRMREINIKRIRSSNNYLSMPYRELATC